MQLSERVNFVWNIYPLPSPCRAWFYRWLILLLLNILRSWWHRQPVEGNSLLAHSLLPLRRALGEPRDDRPGVLGLAPPLLHHGHQLEGGAGAELLLAEGGIVARERGVVKGGSDDLVAKWARKGSIDGDGGLGGAHVEGLRPVAKAREDYGLLQGTDFHKNGTRESPLCQARKEKSQELLH